MLKISLTFIFLFGIVLNFILSGGLVIESVNRNIILKSHVVRIQYRIKFKNNGDESIDTVLFSIPKEKYLSIGYLRATRIGEEDFLEITGPVESTKHPTKQDVLEYSIKLSESLNPKSSISLDIVETLSKYVNPLPSSIKQNENQKLLFIENMFFFTSYEVETQTTNVLLPNSNVESYSEDITVSHKGKDINYGPFSKQNAYSFKELKIHYLYNDPYIHISTLLREIEISHWGNLAVEEHYVIHHVGANLKGGFSRLDYQRGYPNSAPASFRDVTAYLPLEAKDIYFRDRIGNISTSTCIVSEDKKNLLVSFSQRFPLFGGWKTTFYIGYNLPLSSYLKKQGNKYLLNTTFSTSFKEAPIDELKINIIIPEGSKNEKLIIPFDVDDKDRSIRKTYLDTFGRTVLTILKSKVVPEHNLPFQVIYDFDLRFFFMEPLLVISALFAFCLICIVYVRMDFTISKSGYELNEEKTALVDLIVEKYILLSYDREEMYLRIEDATPLINQGLYDEYNSLKGEIVEEKKIIDNKVDEIIGKVVKRSDVKTANFIRKIEQMEKRKFKLLINIHILLKKIKDTEVKSEKESFRKRKTTYEEEYDSLNDKILDKLEYIK